MPFDIFTSADDKERRDRILGGGSNPARRRNQGLTPSIPGKQRFNVSEIQNLMQHGGFFDATDINTWSNGSHVSYQYPSDFDVFETSVELSQDPYVRKTQLEDYFLIRVPIKDESTGTITSELRLFPRKSIHTRYLGPFDMFHGITNPLQVAYQVRQDITRFPPENPQMIQNYFSHIRHLALSMKGTGHDESIKNVYHYLTKEINYTALRDNYFKKMRQGFGVIERFGPKSVGKLVHAVRSRFHGIDSSTSYHSQSGLTAVYDGEGVGRGVAGTMLYMLSFLGVHDVHAVEGIAPDPDLAHLRPAAGWSEQELIQLRHAWIRIGVEQYDPTRDIGKNADDYVWFRKTEQQALNLGHEWYNKIPSFIREKGDIPWRFFFALGASLAAMTIALYLAAQPDTPPQNNEPSRPDTVPTQVDNVPLIDEDESAHFLAPNYKNFDFQTPTVKQTGNVFDNLHREKDKEYKIISYIFRGKEYKTDDTRDIRAYGDFVLRSNGQWEFVTQPLHESQEINIQYTLSDGTKKDTSTLILHQEVQSAPELYEVDRDIDKLIAALEHEGVSEIPEKDKNADVVIIDRSGSMQGNFGYENMKFFALLLGRLAEKYKLPMTFYAYDDTVEKILDWNTLTNDGLNQNNAKKLIVGMSPRGTADTSSAFLDAVDEAQKYVVSHPDYSGRTRILCFTDGDIENATRPSEVEVKGFGINIPDEKQRNMVNFFGTQSYTPLNPQEKILDPDVRKKMVKAILKSFLPKSVLARINLDQIYK